MALATTANLKQYLGISGSEHDSRLAELVSQSQGLIERWARRRFDSQTYTAQTIDGSGRPALMLPQYPVVTLSEIRVDAARSFGSETVIASDRYFVESAAGLVHLKSGVWLAGDSVVLVTYTAGYASDAIPSDLKTACLITAADLWSRSRALEQGSWQNEPSVDSVAGQGYYSFKSEHDVRSGLPVRATAIVNNYRTT